MTRKAKRTTPATGRTDNLQSIDLMLKPHFDRFGITSDQLKNLGTASRVKKILSGYYRALGRVNDIGRRHAKRLGVSWDPSKTTLDNLEVVLSAKAATAGEGAPNAPSFDIRKWAETLNHQLKFPFSRLPNDAAAAFRMVIAQLDVQQKEAHS